jgi:hypothetical protein
VSSGDRGPSALNSADPIRNFTLSVEERVRALTSGVPAWSARKRKIEDEEARLVAELVELHDALVAKASPPAAIERSLIAAAGAFDLDKLNELVLKHNRYYPIEANLPMDPRGRGYLVYGRLWQPDELYTPGRIIALVRRHLGPRGTD